jgi:hypothetical protein
VLGIDVLILDFGIGGLPRLAVLMASFPDVVLDWVGRHGVQFNASEFREALSRVAATADFEAAMNRLAAKLLGMAGYDGSEVENPGLRYTLPMLECTTEARAINRRHSANRSKVAGCNRL